MKQRWGQVPIVAPSGARMWQGRDLLCPSVFQAHWRPSPHPGFAEPCCMTVLPCLLSWRRRCLATHSEIIHLGLDVPMIQWSPVAATPCSPVPPDDPRPWVLHCPSGAALPSSVLHGCFFTELHPTWPAPYCPASSPSHAVCPLPGFSFSSHPCWCSPASSQILCFQSSSGPHLWPAAPCPVYCGQITSEVLSRALEQSCKARVEHPSRCPLLPLPVLTGAQADT